MTEVLALMNVKGGSGKTTIARGLLGVADARGLKVGFVDTDKTANFYDWAVQAHARGHWSEGIEAHQVRDAAKLDKLITQIRDEGDLDLVIVDTPGDASAIHEVMFGLGDLVLCPTLLTAQAVNTAAKTANSHYRLRQKIGDLDAIAQFRVVLNDVATRLAWPYRKQLLRIQNEPLVGDGTAPPVERLACLRTSIKHRSAYADIEDEGLLDRLIASKTPAQQINLVHLVDARDEMGALLDECLALIREDPA